MKNMVKKIFALAFLLITTIVVAGQNDALLAFSTKGPDRYADGTPVQVGEAYALVWSRTGSEFAGVVSIACARRPACSQSVRW